MFFMLAKRSVAFPPIDRRGIWTCCEGWLTRGVLGVRIRCVMVVLRALTAASRPRILVSMEDIQFVHIQQSYYYRSALHAGGAVIHMRKPYTHPACRAAELASLLLFLLVEHDT